MCCDAGYCQVSLSTKCRVNFEKKAIIPFMSSMEKHQECNTVVSGLFMMFRACKLKAFPGVPEAEPHIQIVCDVFVFVCSCE